MVILCTAATGRNTEGVNRLIGKLSDEDKGYIGEGYWVDSDRVISRTMAIEHGEFLGFADAYLLPKYPKAGLIVLAVDPNHRKQHIATKMLKVLIKDARRYKDHYGINELVYHVDTDNDKSKKLAINMGFIYGREFRENPNGEKVLEYYLPL